MTPEIQVTLHGGREIEANLKMLREQFGVRTGGIVIRGLRAGAKLIRDQARSLVRQVPSGLVPASLLDAKGRIRVRKGRKVTKRTRSIESLLRGNIIEHAIPTGSRLAGGKPMVLVRVRNHGYTRRDGKIVFNRPGSSPGWWWWLEFGTSRMPARPFMRPAFEAKKFAALVEARFHMQQEIEAFARKHFATLRKAA